ncbi:heat-inducible transcriptional repressor HrcA [Nostocoides vanveenii]|uniref:Heat-inducible transcription repressor HrcA n=1 Tax=Nostocoides vanveenii TaxID=330835 RepID=A0ABP4WRW4_9MICO
MQDRRLAVLGAIVQDYVSTSEPVGSKSLLERHQLGVSAATIRNDMAALEEDGLIVAPHTSAGRIPTDAGYRLFVDRLLAIKPMSRAEQAAIAEFLSGAVDLDDVVDRTVRLLASLTRQVAVMQYPSLTRSDVRHIELVPVGEARLMLVLITTTGRVEQRTIEVAREAVADEDLVARLRAGINATASGRRLGEAAAALSVLPDSFAPSERDVVRRVIGALDEALIEEREERVVMAGTANLARRPGDFPATLEPVLDALEQHVVLLRLLSTAEGGQQHIAVRIGHENPVTGLQSTSMVTTGYGTGGDLVGGLGVLGPTRMDYPASMAAVRAVAAYVSALLTQ